MKQYLIKYRLRLIIITLIIVVRQLLLVMAQELNAGIFNKLAERSLVSFIWIIAGMVVVWMAVIILDATLNLKEESVSLDIQQSIRENVSTRMTESSYQTFQSKSKGNYLSWLNNDIQTISQKGLRQYFNLVRGISGVLFAAIAMFRYHWSLLLATCAGFICMFFIPKFFNKRIYEISNEVTIANEQFVADIEDQLNGYPVYFAFSSFSQFVTKIQWLSQVLKKVMMKQVKLETKIIAVNFSINVFFQILLTFIAAICYFNGLVLIGAVAIVGSLADIIFSGLGDISFQITSIKSVTPIFDKFETLIPEDISTDAIYGTPLYQANDLDLSYGDDQIFKGISFVIHQGDKYLISGLSGSGKSSLLKLLIGYNHEYGGTLLYKGKDIKEISSKSIAKGVYYLSQQTHVFNGTVRENIELGNTYSDDRIIEVLKLVGLVNISSILEMEAKKLSGGQIQRLALARVIIRNPDVIICDEITSSLDKDSGKMIEEILLSQPNLTVIMITHSLHSDLERFHSIIEL